MSAGVKLFLSHAGEAVAFGQAVREHLGQLLKKYGLRKTRIFFYTPVCPRRVPRAAPHLSRRDSTLRISGPRLCFDVFVENVVQEVSTRTRFRHMDTDTIDLDAFKHEPFDLRCSNRNKLLQDIPLCPFLA